MPRNTALAHIIRQDDGSSVGVWGEYVLHSAFQPIFAFKDERLVVIAFEGLMRPFHGEEALSPYIFLSRLAPSDRLDIETLTRNLHLVNAAAFLPVEADIFVNFNPSLFTHQTVVEQALQDMRSVLDIAGIAPARLVCEVTEQKSGSREALRQLVEALRKCGFRIAVDDYGSDESDMNRIRELRPDIIKFDGRWINRLMDSSAGYGLLSALVANFEAKGIRTVFEGIEQGWQIELTEKAGVSMMQGFALARPQIVPEVFAAEDGEQHKAGADPSASKTGPEETDPEPLDGPARDRSGSSDGE
ncbi:EAL domain-containing protein [Oryzicola mucosus]|uniref:EAL domain-containing protein n=1 Tax=Oryzicola mucosus TaxID=2767425 RepID=A0A8J6PNG6_9HYPH|nr:EAL domain-containing protein [Oryzicola mucosus]